MASSSACRFHIVALAAALVAAAAPTPALAANSAGVDSALLWQGFRHDWQYNHRINRLGDYLTMTCAASTCDGLVNHTADTGTGADTGTYYSHFAAITSEYAAFQTGSRKVDLLTTEGSYISGTTRVSVLAAADMDGRDRYVALLNGFDLDSVKEAKQLDYLRIELANLAYSAGYLTFDVNWGFKVDCDTPECSGSSAVDYDLRVYYLLVAGDENELRFKNATAQHSYAWDGPTGSFLSKYLANLNNFDEDYYSDHDIATKIAGDTKSSTVPSFAAGTVGLRGFKMNLDAAHHMLSTIARVRNLSYNATGNGSAFFTADVYFKNWTRNMKSFNLGAFGEAGDATAMELYTTLLQLRQATIVTDTVSGSIDTDTSDQETIEIGF
ncbi:MAG: hypothetical protein HYV63_11505 [Candidatus Schekmanbacteria bacterium]|nr:hypothetical protein [Candidatus Schekmanbacteria bacterium]